LRLGSHKCYMEKEIHEQPESIKNTTAGRVNYDTYQVTLMVSINNILHDSSGGLGRNYRLRQRHSSLQKDFIDRLRNFL